ncbi:MAG: hypothetical protein AAGU15_07875 [Anaerolineaceae bacterium]
MPKRHLLVILAMATLLAVFAGCQVVNAPQPAPDISQATRSAAATAQAERNFLQNEAWLLEQDLDANFSDHYVGMQIEAYPEFKAIVYLTDASKADLEPFVDDSTLFDAIEVREEAISRQTIRETREALKAELDEVGIEHTTEIKMEPARLIVYVYDAVNAQELLNSAGYSVPENIEFVESETLPGGG